jgi:hypothetical protein
MDVDVLSCDGVLFKSTLKPYAMHMAIDEC